MTPDEHSALFGRPEDLPPLGGEIKWTRMTARSKVDPTQVVVFYLEGDTLMCHRFTEFGEE